MCVCHSEREWWIFFPLHCVLQTVRFKNELERNITIKLGYANAKVRLIRVEAASTAWWHFPALSRRWLSDMLPCFVYRSLGVTIHHARHQCAIGRRGAAKRIHFHVIVRAAVAGSSWKGSFISNSFGCGIWWRRSPQTKTPCTSRRGSDLGRKHHWILKPDGQFYTTIIESLSNQTKSIIVSDRGHPITQKQVKLFQAHHHSL